jgi:hypothetical protein
MSGTVRHPHRARARAVASTTPHQSGLFTAAGMMMGLLALWALLVTI